MQIASTFACQMHSDIYCNINYSTILCHHMASFSLQLVKISCQFNRITPAIYLPQPSDKVAYGQPPCLSTFNPITSKAVCHIFAEHILLCAVAKCVLKTQGKSARSREGCLVAAWYHTQCPARCPRLYAHLRRCHCMWLISIGLNVNEFRFSLYYSDGHA